MKRRAWLLSGAGALGALVVGWGALPARSRLGSGKLWPINSADTSIALNGWIKITTDGSVVLAMARSEMGQGVHTALAMLVAEELDLPLSRIKLTQAGSDAIYGNVAMLVSSLPFHPSQLGDSGKQAAMQIRLSQWMVGKVARELGIHVTGGSSSVADAWEPLRLAAATARASLLGAASLAWKLPLAELKVKNGVVSHASGLSAHYGEFAKYAASTPPGNVNLKARKDWTLIGQSAPRTDVPANVNGTAMFGTDVRLPGMVYAAVRLCPMLGGSPGAINASAALAMPGVLRIVPLQAWAGSSAGFAVIGKTWWHAQQAAQAVQLEWQQRPAGALDSRAIEKELLAAVVQGTGHVFFEQGDVAAAESAAARKLEATYSAPYLAHATLEPMNCTAQVTGGKVFIWVPSQVPQMAAAVAARVAGVDIGDVTVVVTLLGGGFGRRLEVDFVAQAVRVAMDSGGQPVQLIWSREEDMTHDFYRPMAIARLQASIDTQGVASSLRIQSAGDAISPRWFERAATVLRGPLDMPDKTTAEGLFGLPYALTHQKMSHVATRSSVPVGYWRSVGHSHNAFFSECFMDELALAAGQDALAFRRSLLKNAPRHLAVLSLAAAKAGWGTTLPAGQARGIALHESFGSIVAQVVVVSLEAGVPRVHQVVCAIDCGTVVNPGIVAQQMEGAVVFGLSAALYGRIDIHDGRVQQKNFSDYGMQKLASSPQVFTHIVSSQAPPSGVGEPGVPPLAPAVANAMFALSGKRQRVLPLIG
ncbi:MAG: molybdopterin cofactor-binding domain-containing protein [Polaromonas sp.]|jgi:isoquinoline 1-oxidoreductase beta subunit